MQVALRYLFRAFAGLLVMLGLIVTSLTIYMRTASFNQLLEREVNDLLNGRFRGEVTIGSIQASCIGRVGLSNLAITYQGRELLRVPVVEIGYTLLPLLWHQLNLDITVEHPHADLARDASGAWDLAEALQSTAPSSGTPSAYTVTLSALVLNDGTIELAPDGLSGPRYQISDTNLDARVELLRSGITLDARKLSAHLEAPKLPPADVTLAASYDASSQPATLDLSSLNLSTQASSLSATATVTNPRTPTFEAHITVARLSASDLKRLKSYPLRDDITGSIEIHGPLSALHAVLDLAAGPAHADLVADADLTHPQRSAYNGTLSLTHLDLARLALGIKLAGQLDTSVRMTGQGTQLSSINALNAVINTNGRNLIINNVHAGNAKLTADAKDGRASLTASLTNRSSTITANASLTNFAAPDLQAQIVTRRLDLQTLAGSRSPKSDLNATLKLDAPRIDPAQLNLAHLDAHALLTLARSSLQNVAISNGSVDARLHGGVVNLTQMNLFVAGATLTTRGDVGVVPRMTTRLAYSLRAQHLAPLMQLAQLKGDGSLALTGTAGGVLVGPYAPSLKAQGSATSNALSLNGINAAHASIDYNFAGVGQGGVPLGHVQIDLAGVASGTTRLRVLDFSTQVTRQKPAALSLAINLVDAHGNAHSAAAELAEQKGNVAGALTQLTVIAPDGPWHLAAPSHFVAGPRAISIDSFNVRNGPRELAFSGTMRIAGPQNVTVTARNLDFGLIQPLLQPNQHPVGTFAADIAITGTAAAPLIRANLTGNSLAIDSQRIGDLTLHVNYNPGTAGVNLALYQDRTHQMTLTGIVPMTVDWAHGFHAHLGNDVALRLYSAGLRLAGLAELAPPRTIKDATGQLTFDLAISGPPFHPAATGTIALQNLGGQIIPLGLKINDSSAQMRVTPELFTLDHLAINAGGGTITSHGTVALANYAPGAVNLIVTIQKFPAIHTERYQATLGGELHLSGTPDAPDLTGRVDVLNASVHPDLAFLTATKYQPDATIVVIRPGDKNQPAASIAKTEQNAATPAPSVHSSLFDNLAVNVAIVVHRDSWIRHPDASVELAGHLQAVKQRHGPLTLVGEIDTVRGWITFNGKTFTLASGQILFTGGHTIDPSLNLDAQYSVSDYTIDVLVTGFASKPQLKLQSSPPLPQSDILSLLIFGSTSSSLGQSQSASLQQQATQLAAGAAASTIGQALSSSLGLEDLGVDLNGSAGDGGVGFGRYLGHNTYLSASQSTTGRKVSIQYYVRRWLSLTTSTNSDGSSEIFVNLTKQY
jgi:translocation and assembly module TamB